jgi:hypothetical protein
VIGVCSADLTDGGIPTPVSCSLGAAVGGVGSILISLTPLGFPLYDQGTISVDFSYEVSP